MTSATASVPTQPERLLEVLHLLDRQSLPGMTRRRIDLPIAAIVRSAAAHRKILTQIGPGTNRDPFRIGLPELLVRSGNSTTPGPGTSLRPATPAGTPSKPVPRKTQATT